MVDSTIVTNFINALNNKFENKVSNKKTSLEGDYTSDTTSYPTVQAVKSYISTQLAGLTNKEDNSNKVTSWSNPTTDTNYPSEKLVKDSLDEKADTSSLSTVATSGSYNDLSNKPTIPSKTSDLTDDVGFLTTHQDISGKEDKTNKTSSWNSTTNNTRYPTEKLVKDSLDTKVDKVTGKTLTTNDFTNTYKNTLDNLSTTLNGLNVEVEKQQTAEAGYIATYHVLQGNTKVGDSINIPKDFLVKSATLETVTVADTPVTGYNIGDEYFDFVINTKDNSSVDEHLYLNATSLKEDYNADETSLTENNNTFSVKDGGVGLSKLSNSVQTSLGYADNWNTSPAHGITNANITSWNGKSDLTTSDVDTEIEAYLTAITNAL